MGKKYSEGKDYKVIACVLSNFFNDEQSRVMRYVAQECESVNCKVVFFSTTTDFYYDDLVDAGEKNIFSLIAVDRFDAVILMSESFKQDEEQLELVKRANLAGVPIFAVDKCFDGCINVVFDYGDCFKEIVRHMVKFHGYRNVAFMAGMPDNRYSQERLEAYREVLAKEGIPYDENNVYYGYFWEKPTEAAMEQLFAKVEAGLPMPEAIICANDAMALAVLNCLQKKGYRVPEDVAVTGFDGIELERYSNPRLTTGIYNINSMIQTILQRVTEGNTDVPEQPIPIYNKMRIGRSCGCDGLESLNITDEIRSINGKVHLLMQYQVELSQMVASYGNAEKLRTIAEALPEYMSLLGYKDFWLGFEESFLDMMGVKEPLELLNKNVWDRPVGMLHYHKEASGKANRNWETLLQSDIIPGLDDYLEGTACCMVTVLHVAGVKIGYAVVGFDYKEFYYLAYNPFLTNLRNLLQLQQSQRQIIYNYERDQLTGLYNRNGFYKKLGRFFDSPDLNLSVIFIDMDGLKGINDTYGHAEGDEALRNIAGIIADNAGDELNARIGGDEFVIVFAGKDDGEQARERKSLIIQGLDAYNQSSEKPYKLRASIGVFTDCIFGHTIDYFLKHADSMMYIEKTQHRKELENNR